AFLRVDGERVGVITGFETVEFTRVGDDVLEGRLTLKDGQTFPVTLTRADRQMINPETLIGTWIGQYVGRAKMGGDSVAGQYFVTIENVTPSYINDVPVGSKVYGRVGWREYKAGPRETRLVGTLVGNRLAFGKAVLVVEGQQMRGFDGLSDITLTKQK